MAAPCHRSLPDGVVAFDLTAPAQVFASAARPGGEPLYEFSTCSLDGGPVATTSGFAVAPPAGIEALARRETVVLPGYASLFDAAAGRALTAMRDAAERGARLSLVLHRRLRTRLRGRPRRPARHHPLGAGPGSWRTRFPAVGSSRTSLFVDEGEVLTSAGLSAGHRPQPARDPP